MNYMQILLHRMYITTYVHITILPYFLPTLSLKKPRRISSRAIGTSLDINTFICIDFLNWIKNVEHTFLCQVSADQENSKTFPTNFQIYRTTDELHLIKHSWPQRSPNTWDSSRYLRYAHYSPTKFNTNSYVSKPFCDIISTSFRK